MNIELHLTPIHYFFLGGAVTLLLGAFWQFLNERKGFISSPWSAVSGAFLVTIIVLIQQPFPAMVDLALYAIAFAGLWFFHQKVRRDVARRKSSEPHNNPSNTDTGFTSAG